MVRLGADALQVVVGPISDQLAAGIRRGLRSGAAPGAPDAVRLLSALGGGSNLREVRAASTRLLVRIADDALVDEAALNAAASRGYARPEPGCVQVLVGPAAADLSAALEGAKAR